jgi:hypothetical protein
MRLFLLAKHCTGSSTIAPVSATTLLQECYGDGKRDSHRRFLARNRHSKES